VFDERCKKHITGPGHPESPARMDAVQRALREANCADRLQPIAPLLCQDESILLCHSQAYLTRAVEDITKGYDLLSTGDTSICRDTLEAARLAAGGVLAAVDAVVRGQVDNAFCAMRPPGHHATPTQGMGFCVFSNVAIAARYAQQQYGIGKVLIVDWDVHHGNGTQDVFYEDDSVFFFSTHQSPWYPGTGAASETGTGRGLGSTMNAPLPAGAGRKEVLGAFTHRLLPAVAKFKPELVFISAGFDSRAGDPLGGFLLTDDDFRDLTRMMLAVAEDYADGRLVSVLEGGYSLDGLRQAVQAHLETLAD
jgi:acetoin utilization deacetylase AcuC-like enzyme